MVFLKNVVVFCSLISLSCPLQAMGSYDPVSFAITLASITAANAYEQYAFSRELDRFKEASRPALLARVKSGEESPPFGASVIIRDNQLIGCRGRRPSGEIPPEEIEKLKQEIIHNPSKLLGRNQVSLWKHQVSVVDPEQGYLSGYMPNPDRDDSNNPDDPTKWMDPAMVAALIKESIVSRNRQDNPLWALDECVGTFSCVEGERPCALTRFTDTGKARLLFEEMVVGNKLKRQLRLERGGPVTLVNVGSCDLFQDLVLMTQIGERYKDKQGGIGVNLVCIDRIYKKYIAAMNNKETRETAEYDHDEYSIQKTHLRFTQLSRWLTQAYPQHRYDIFLYDSVEKYVAALAENPHLAANIYMGADLDESRDFLRYLKYAEGDSSEYKNGSEAYLSAPLRIILKPYGVGLMLKKCSDLPQAPGVINHCFELLPENAPRPDDSALVSLETPQLSGRYFVVKESYRRPLLPIHIWRRLFGM